MSLSTLVEQALRVAPTGIEPLSGGCVGQVYAVNLADGRRVVAKVDERSEPCLEVEGYMLRYLAKHSNLPVPAVLHATPRLLIMEFVRGASSFPAEAQAHAAELLAALHQVSAPHFGLERDTLIGGLLQPNPIYDNWLPFFRDQRLTYMARKAEEAGRLPAEIRARVERIAADLERWLKEPESPSLIHGDVWTTNVLATGQRVTGFVDPAIYYAHPEVELAFITLFDTFGDAFFNHYRELRPLAPGFFEVRRHIYNLYPLLVHVCLFGGTYVGSVQTILDRFGY